MKLLSPADAWQVQQKRCGHLLGKQLVDREEYYSRLRAAVLARDQLQSEMLIIARTDAKQTYGFDEAMERLNKAVEIGVDVVFFEALASEEEARQVCQAMKKTNTPVLLNMVPGGVTPNMTAEQARDVGFRIMIVPGVCIAPVVRSVTEELEYLKKEGGVPKVSGHEGVVKAFRLCGLDECVDIDQKAGGKAYTDVQQSR